ILGLEVAGNPGIERNRFVGLNGPGLGAGAARRVTLWVDNRYLKWASLFQALFLGGSWWNGSPGKEIASTANRNQRDHAAEGPPFPLEKRVESGHRFTSREGGKETGRQGDKETRRGWRMEDREWRIEEVGLAIGCLLSSIFHPPSSTLSVSLSPCLLVSLS